MGLGGYWDRVAYCSSKAAVINMGRVLAVEWGPLNIRVNAVCPAFVITPLTAPLFEQNPDFTEDVIAPHAARSLADTRRNRRRGRLPRQPGRRRGHRPDANRRRRLDRSLGRW